MPPPDKTSTPPSTASSFSTLHPDVIESHILTRLDGPDLASAASCSTTLRRLSSSDDLWSNICHSTWPSTTSPRATHVISTFPHGGPRAFFSHVFPLFAEINLSRSSSTPPPELISAVDVHYDGNLIFTKIHETDTQTAWFRCSPFRIDLLEAKDVVPTSIKHSDGGGAAAMTLSWILIDPTGRRAVNLSSHTAVAAQRHWLTGEEQVTFASILAIDRGHVEFKIVVTCGVSENGEMQVRQVSLEVEDMDGMHLNGKDSLVILQGAMEGKRGTGIKRVEEGQRRYKEYVEMKRERRERKLRAEGVLDMFCMACGVSIFVSFLVLCFVQKT
ncbi:hypothetical protein BUALT_Bualt11G0092600 [Buddleja alternifolia]|uniref:F-box domain-containing protein n=1 Tax=Buddleja alternifolia TaxID=168488 RepID=A0AAV6X4J0_9LAMI|nr:hypothetical protein BUALT_Bualt11G0092600 [Buddleja alternifolia]